jgi:hypothetical protein
MPRRFERHARSKDSWESPPGRAAERGTAAAEHDRPAPRPKARKDTRSWCRGKTGVEHTGTLVLQVAGPRPLECCWRHRFLGDREIRWECWHREACARCGRVLREPWQLEDSECPAWPGSGEQRAAAEREAARSVERWREWQAQRRPVVTGPQGYRRRRSA